MKKRNPERNSIISWIILGIGALFAVVGAMTAQEYRINLCLTIGFLVIIGGIIYHLVMVRCPHCGYSLAGYQPLPEECPKCQKAFEK